MVKVIMVFFILQWNARSLIANGQEFKKYVQELTNKPDIICIQETWLKPHLDFILKGYHSIRLDRKKDRGGGCITFIKEGISFTHINTVTDHENVVTEIFNGNKEKLTVINYYNPCKAITHDLMRSINKGGQREIWCGDFNAHNSLWGSKYTDLNGEVLEEMINDRMLVCLNNGNGTRINIYKNETSCIDLTLIDRRIASRCEWEVDHSTSMGSDHFPILCKIDIDVKIDEMYAHHRWCFKKANWEKFNECCIDELNEIHDETDQSIDEMNHNLSMCMVVAASQSIPNTMSQKGKTNVPWWNEECSGAIKKRNRAFKILRTTLTMDNLMDYQRKKALARKVIKEAKKESWRQFCSTIRK